MIRNLVRVPPRRPWHDRRMTSVHVTALTGLTNRAKSLRGESNLIRREDDCVGDEVRIAAVDTGNRKSTEIAEVLCRSNIQILVLTHDDDDHIKGAEYVLRNSPEPIRELWIPAYWMMQDQILDRLSKFGRWTDQDSEEIDAVLKFGRTIISEGDGCFEESLFAPLFDVSYVERQRTEYPRDKRYPSGSSRSAGVDDTSREVPSELKQVHIDGLHEATRLFKDAELDIQKLAATNPADPDTFPKRPIGAKELARRTRESIDSIQRILVAAKDRRTLIRCFLPVTDRVSSSADGPAQPVWESSGIPEFLSLINAVEVVVRAPRISSRSALFMSLVALGGLSRQNRCALVSFVWPTGLGTGDGFIIWSDSSGDWMDMPRFSVPWEEIGGMTAPHHGSDNIAHHPIWNEMVTRKGSTKVIVSGDLNETKGSKKRATAVSETLSHFGVKEYGVVHCLDPVDSTRFPRAEVDYFSATSNCCAEYRDHWKHWYLPGERTHTKISVSPFGAKCNKHCLKCKAY